MNDGNRSSHEENNENILNTEENDRGIVRNDTDGEKSEEAHQQENQENQEALSQEGEAYASQENEAHEQKDLNRKEVQKNFKGEKEKIKRKKKKNGSFGIVLIAVVLVIAVITTLLCGVASVAAVNGLLWIGDVLYSIGDGMGNENDGEDSGNAGGNGALYEDMNVIKNDGSIDVYENVGSTGYNDTLTVSQVVELVADTVVEITTSSVVNDRFYGQYVTSGAGSGVIITENGYIITNHHVIDGAQDVTVRLTDGSEFSAVVIGSDEEHDIALIKISASGLDYAKMGSSASLVVGEDVIAIGNPLGSLGGTVTDGIISALDRKVVVDGHQMTLMQTNAAINPGNSGGGLFDMSGQLIGIVNAKQSNTGIEGLGFAIPIDVAWEAVKGIVNNNTRTLAA